jgi:hypothetical protein
MPRRVALSVLLAATMAVAIQLPAQAKKFSAQDADALSAIAKRLQVAYRDSLYASRGLITGNSLNDNECLTSITDAVNVTDEIISSTATLTFLSGAMDSPADESLVDRFLVEEIRHSLKSIDLTRQVINLAAGNCGTSAVVVNKAHIFLSILNDGDRILSAFGRRF